MSRADVFGEPLSASTAFEVDAFDRAAHLLLAYDGDPVGLLDPVLEQHPDFIAGRILRAEIRLIASDERFQAPMRDDLLRLREQAGRANDRERAHIHAIALWAAGDWGGASAAFADILLAHPRDLPALQIGHQIDFLLGTAATMRDRPARVIRHWHQADAWLPYVLGMQAFGLEEANHYHEAETVARRCLALNPGDTWGIHALAHCLEMQGRVEEGIDFLEGTEARWYRQNALAIHNRWHLALYYIEQGRFLDALELHDRYMVVGASSALMDWHDSVGMLWRLTLDGVDVGDRWRPAADRYEEVVDQAYVAFTDLHAMIAFAATEREEPARAVIAALRARASDPTLRGAAIRVAGLPVAEGLYAFARGDLALARTRLLAARPWSHLFGGSVAQRDILNLTLIEIAARQRDRSLFDALIAERTQLKPVSRLTDHLQRRFEAGA